ncbi:adhesion G protein-coupled receptor E1-like [Mytilus trossulus]|uniref:adhesion G protein-coupled receptor E1-like n=1 Tax=Mytilus trossulus TaxID=6551 RepID=UPI0030055043
MLFNEPKVENTENCFNYYMNPVVRAMIGKRELYMNVFCVPPDYGCSCLGSSDSFGQWYNWFPLSVVFSFTERNLYCNNKVNKLCIETELYTGYRIDKIVHWLHSFALEVKMIKQIQLVLAWSFRRDVETLGMSVYRTYKKNKTHYVTPINMRLKIIKKLNSIEMLKFETKLHNCLWFMRIKSSTSHDFEFSTFKLERLLNENITNGTSLNSTGLSYKEVNVSIKTSFSEQLCDSYSIESELEEKTAAMIVTKVTCWNELDQTLTSQDFRKNIITYTGMAASIIALTVYLTVHRKFGMHKTIPGSNVENLSIALLLSDILFMVGVGANDHYIVCYTVGVVLHYLWLSVFSFKSVALIYMCHNIRQMSANNAHALGIKNKKAYLTVLGLLLPVIFVGPAVILDLVIPGVNLDYSGSICFPTGYPANLIFVSAPIGLSVLINVVSLMCIALVITKQSYETRHIRKSSSFKFILVFVRISIVTGAFWVTGVLGAVVRTEFMEYLFIITCSIQGLLFAIANLSTRRVSKSIRKSYD